MSHDLFLRPRAPRLVTEKDFTEYFAQRARYKITGSQAWYENEDTGVYFVFELRDEVDREEEGEWFPIVMNVNYFRPSFLESKQSRKPKRSSAHSI
jgi:hypothetical protein